MRLRRWTDPAVLAAAGLAAAAGFAQFGVAAALSEVAAEFGEAVPVNGIAAEVGMTGTALGVGLAIIRLAAIGSLPAASVADWLGRRGMLLSACGVGLFLTVAAGFSPTYWWFVALLALARPLLTATAAVAGVVVAEETASSDRAKAVALVGAAYAVGTGLIAGVRAVAPEALGLRGIFWLAAVPLALLPLLGRIVQEPARFARSASDGQRRRLGRVPSALAGRLSIICGIHFGVGFLTGPLHTYLFLYGEQILGFSPAAMFGVFLTAGACGLAGLLVGRWGADQMGRRVTAGAALGAAAAAGFTSYSGPAAGLVVGYPLAVLAASTFTPAAGALDAELFPTSVRATAAGWLTAAQIVGGVMGLAAFGVLTDVFQAFSPAAAAVAVPAAALALLYTRLPETRGLELEESAPEHGAP